MAERIDIVRQCTLGGYCKDGAGNDGDYCTYREGDTTPDPEIAFKSGWG